MCLNKLDEKARKRGGYGYKLLQQLGTDEEPYTHIQGRVILPIGKWKADPNISDRYTETFGRSSPQKYPTGFHIFPTLVALREWRGRMGWMSLRVFKVQFKDVVASGSQRDCRVIVARKVKVIEKVVRG